MNPTRMLQRPIYGGVFGEGLYALATLPTIANGLHAVRFMVVDQRGGAVLSVADDKREAMASARRFLCETLPESAANDALWQQDALWPDLPLDHIGKVKPISRRRREIFERSEARCHYCRTFLKLDGKWHIEHMVPRALGGADGAGNLVAACAPCNLAKRDRTALEFLSSNSILSKGD